ncbi:MAG: hypothetical protein ABI592_03415 [Acidobacteriota bacterium]
MSFRARILLVGILAAFLAPDAARPADWGIGASFGAVNDISHRFQIEEFHARDWNAWLEFGIEDHVQLRGTYGSLRAPADTNSAASVRSDVDYGTIGVSYEFLEGESDYTSGLFAGFGGYRVRPDGAPADTVFGWHAGVDGSIRIISKLSAVGRITAHRFRSGGGRTMLSGTAGLLFRF